jgi:hypothetical protein
MMQKSPLCGFSPSPFTTSTNLTPLGVSRTLDAATCQWFNAIDFDPTVSHSIDRSIAPEHIHTFPLDKPIAWNTFT